MDEGIIGFNSDGQCNFSNAAAQKILGFAENEIQASNIAELISCLDAEGGAIAHERTAVYRALNFAERAHVTDEMFVGNNGSVVAVDYSVSQRCGVGVSQCHRGPCYGQENGLPRDA
jgi:PAS domain-containing protein